MDFADPIDSCLEQLTVLTTIAKTTVISTITTPGSVSITSRFTGNFPSDLFLIFYRRVAN